MAHYDRQRELQLTKPLPIKLKTEGEVLYEMILKMKEDIEQLKKDMENVHENKQ